jgi:hypothetical protein
MEHDLFGKPVPTFPDHALAQNKLPAREKAADGLAQYSWISANIASPCGARSFFI